MMRPYNLLYLVLLSIGSFGQPPKVTSDYAGLYDMGGDIEKGRVGSILVYPETDRTILFYIALNRGAPSYNSGHLYGRLELKDGKGTFDWKPIYSEKGCKLSFEFTDNNVEIKYIEYQDQCRFGFSVWANGEYLKKSSTKPEYFVDPEGNRIYFDRISPEEYNKE